MLSPFHPLTAAFPGSDPYPGHYWVTQTRASTHSRSLLLSDLTGPCLQPRSLLAPPLSALHQSRSYLVAPGPALPLFHSTVAPPPNGFTPTTLLSSGSGACPSAPLHQPRSYLVAPGPAPHAFALGHAPQRPKTNHALTQSLLAASPPLTHRFRRPAVPQMTFMFSKRMLLTRPLSMAPGNWASSACSTSRWVKSSSGCGCRRENLSP